VLERNAADRLQIQPGSEDCTAIGGTVYPNYLNSELALQSEIREELIRNRIALTVLIDSRQVGPSYVNQQNAGGIYLKPEEIFRSSSTICVGSGPGCIPNEPIIPPSIDGTVYDSWLVSPFGCAAGGSPCTHSPEIRQQYALEFMSTPGVQFRKPFAAFTQVSADTGGVTCVIQPRCDFDGPNPPYARPTGCDGNPYLNGELRQECYSGLGNVQNCSAIDQSESQQSLRCVLGALGLSTYNVVGLAGN
jgi:hypothetical protein